MTSPNVVLELRPPHLTVALYGTSLMAAAVLVVAFLTVGVPPLYNVAFVVAAVAITGYNTAGVLSRARAHADGSLEVRNRLSTRRLQRSDVDRVVLGQKAGFGSPWRLELVLTDGTTLRLVATESPPFPGLRRRLEQQANEMRSWLSASLG